MEILVMVQNISSYRPSLKSFLIKGNKNLITWKLLRSSSSWYLLLEVGLSSKNSLSYRFKTFLSFATETLRSRHEAECLKLEIPHRASTVAVWM